MADDAPARSVFDPDAAAMEELLAEHQARMDALAAERSSATRCATGGAWGVVSDASGSASLAKSPG